MLDDTTVFRAILPPDHWGSAVQSDLNSLDGLILHALTPLQAELDAALADNDRDGALRLAYGALSRVVDVFAGSHSGSTSSDQARIHALVVELEPLPLWPRADGALEDQGIAVQVRYRRWTVTREQGDHWVAGLAERWQMLWPGMQVTV